jgi:hypothetical protein
MQGMRGWHDKRIPRCLRRGASFIIFKKTKQVKRDTIVLSIKKLVLCVNQILSAKFNHRQAKRLIQKYAS